MMVFLGIALFGGVAITKLGIDLLPDIEPPAISILVPYPGATASDVESDVTKYVEDRLSTVNNLDELRSLSKDNLSMVTCKFEWGTDLDVASNDVRDKLDLAKPDIHKHAPDAEEPMLFKFSSATMPVLIVAFTATTSYKQLYYLVDKQVSDPLKRVKGVGAIILYGGLKRQINVEFDKRKLAGYGITVPKIIRVLQAENLDMPGGDVKMGTRRYQIRLKGRFKSPQEVASIIVGTKEGHLIHLGDVAKVTDSFKEPTMHAWANGKNAVILVIQKQAGANTVAVCNAIRERLKELKKNLPADVKYAIPMDNSEFILNSIRNLTQTLAITFVLVGIIGFLFLRKLAPTLIVILNIPFSMIIALVLMFVLGYTINVISLMSLAIAIGMVVSNPIFVTEVIWRHIEAGERPAEAAEFGASEVGMAITASTLTTIVVFAPFIYLTGLVGIIFKQLAIIVTITLLGSIFTAFTLTPMLASRWLKPIEKRKITWFYRLGERFYKKLEQIYGKILRTSLNNRKKIAVATFIVFAMSLAPIKFIGTELFPDVDTGMVSISMAQDESTRLEESARLANRVSRIFKKLVPEMTQRYAFCGETEEGIGTAVGMEEGPNIVEGGAKLVRKKYRHRSSKEVAAAVRKELEKIPGIERMKVIATTPMKQMMLGGGKQIEVEIVGHDLNVTRQLAEKIKKIFLKTPGAVDVTVSFKRPRQEIHVLIDRKKAASLGITAAAVAQVLRSSYYGFEATKYREAGEDFDIFVRLNKPGRSTLDTIGELDIPSLNEQVKTVKLKNIARIVQATGPVQIDRKNRERIITVGADTFGRSLGEVKADVERALKNLDIPPGVTVEFGGEAKEQRKAFRDLYALLIIGGILVVMVIVSQFESFRTPLAVIFAIPFTFTGVILALWLTGLTLNMMSFMAVILLIGVVVNNAIVLLDYADVLRARGIALMDAIVQAGIHRLRPILMTTFTCLFGMLPLAVSRGEGAEMWQPFGVTVIGGLLASTVIGLIIVPIMYSYFAKKEITPERG